MGEIPAANLSANFVEADPPADSQLTDNPAITSHSSTFPPFNSKVNVKTRRWGNPYLSSWHMSRFSLSSGVRRRTQAPSSSVLMSELSWQLQRECRWTPATMAESTVDSPLSAPETERLPVAAGGPVAPQAAAAVPDPAAAPGATPSGLLSEGHTAVILRREPREAWL